MLFYCNYMRHKSKNAAIILFNFSITGENTILIFPLKDNKDSLHVHFTLCILYCNMYSSIRFSRTYCARYTEL